MDFKKIKKLAEAQQGCLIILQGVHIIKTVQS